MQRCQIYSFHSFQFQSLRNCVNSTIQVPLVQRCQIHQFNSIQLELLSNLIENQLEMTELLVQRCRVHKS